MEIEPAEDSQKGDKDKGDDTEEKDMNDEEEDMDTSSVILDAPIEVDVPLGEPPRGSKNFITSGRSHHHHHHRYNVKVVLLSTPTFAEMAEKIFGSEFDHVIQGGGGGGGFGRQQSSAGKSLHLHKQLAALVYRNTESGYSLLGGKWLPEKDGFMPGSGNENPNLIAAAIRLVHEQTGLNLSSCRQWKVFATFVYNRDSNFDPRAASYEITKVYMPDVWTATEGIYAPLGGSGCRGFDF
ncbi:Cell cycle and apoptosis regulator [Tyrophagus putrescentiae]|nr:Cell cycle and apoptosis regulator [Tyrophagus putrescentiae]